MSKYPFIESYPETDRWWPCAPFKNTFTTFLELSAVEISCKKNRFYQSRGCRLFSKLPHFFNEIDFDENWKSFYTRGWSKIQIGHFANGNKIYFESVSSFVIIFRFYCWTNQVARSTKCKYNLCVELKCPIFIFSRDFSSNSVRSKNFKLVLIFTVFTYNLQYISDVFSLDLVFSRAREGINRWQMSGKLYYGIYSMTVLFAEVLKWRHFISKCYLKTKHVLAYDTNVLQWKQKKAYVLFQSTLKKYHPNHISNRFSSKRKRFSSSDKHWMFAEMFSNVHRMSIHRIISSILYFLFYFQMWGVVTRSAHIRC